MSKIIEINGFIEKWGYSSQYLNYYLQEAKNDEVTLKVTSLGGEVQEALKMKDLIATHGNVTVEYIGFNASAATLLGHTAKKSIIHEDAFYLIHKPMVYVDEWGAYNEDELKTAIENLQHAKKDAEVVTLTIAQDYVNSCGLELKNVLELMKEAKWLSAKETVELGLVDEILPSTKKQKQQPVSTNVVAMVTALGLPPIPAVQKENEDKSFLLTLKNIFSSNKNSIMTKEYVFINQTLNVESVEMKDDKITLSKEQISILNSKIQELNDKVTAAETAKVTAETAKTTAETEKTAAVTAKTTAETALSNFTSKIDEIDNSIKNAADADAKVTALKAFITNSAIKLPDTHGGGTKEKGTSTFEDNADYSFNQKADALLR